MTELTDIDKIIDSVAEPNAKGWTGRNKAAKEAKQSVALLLLEARNQGEKLGYAKGLLKGRADMRVKLTQRGEKTE